MDLNFIGIGYLFLRLAPFVLASFFTLASIFNQDWKGVIYLVGLLFSSFITVLSSKLPWISSLQAPQNRPGICNILSFSNSDILSDLPLSISAISYTFAYLLFFIIIYKNGKENIPTLVFFPLLIIFDLIWNFTTGCYSFFQLIISITIGTAIGVLWAYILSTTNSPHLTYFNTLSTKEVCSVASKQTFKCKVYKNGKLLSKNIGGA